LGDLAKVEVILVMIPEATAAHSAALLGVVTFTKSLEMGCYVLIAYFVLYGGQIPTQILAVDACVTALCLDFEGHDLSFVETVQNLEVHHS
jgi:hypothetical protein